MGDLEDKNISYRPQFKKNTCFFFKKKEKKRKTAIARFPFHTLYSIQRLSNYKLTEKSSKQPKRVNKFLYTRTAGRM